MKQQFLHTNWKMKCVEEISWQTAIVPGTVYTDLLRNGAMVDPYFKDNEDAVCKRMEKDYEYETTFTIEEQVIDCDRILLRFDGLDTVADIFFNGVLIGHAENMHRVWEYDVTEVIKRKEENTLRILFHSPLVYIANAYKKYGNIGNDDTYEGFMHLRKAHYMFGWDWGAHLPDAGIFRPVSLLGIKKARWDNIAIHQFHEKNQVSLEMEAWINDFRSSCWRREVPIEETLFSYKVTIKDPDGMELITSDTSKMMIENPRLWQPNGIGEQPLYTIQVKLFDKEECLDCWEKRIGLRTMTMKIEKDEWGESFAHEVNGNTIFAMGADYIPEDHLLGRVNKEKTRKLLERCKWANFNVIRVWGGGYYPDDWFFDLCDELGLIVWQDFMFACSVYELTEQFEEQITKEFIDNIKRIRHHASLGLWCGNNEMEMFVDERCWVTKPSEVRDYLFMYERIIPKVLKKYDRDTFYWPASPSSGGSFDNPNDPNRGDVHYWKVWHGGRPFSEYRKFFFRYASEFGFQALPSKKTIEMFTDDERDMNLFSYIMERHQRNYGAHGKIMNYMQQIYRYPTDFESIIYASQLLQADAIRYGVEHFRRNRGRCMGAVYWQLNDCWPVVSWSSIDYAGRLKALHYYAKRFFAPVMISCEEESWLTKEANMNRQHFSFEKSIRLNVTNETLFEKKMVVRWQLRNAKAEILREEEEEIIVAPLSSSWLPKVLLTQIDVFSEYVSYEAIEEGSVISEGTVIFSYPKYFKYEDPKITLFVEGNTIIVSASAYAKSVEIQNEKEDLILSDNYFDMNGGQKRIQILEGDATSLKARSVYQIG